MYSEVLRVTPKELHALQTLARLADLTSGPGGSAMIGLDCEVFRRALPYMGERPLYDLHAVWLIALYPSAQIVAHTDPPLPGPRVHIPLETNTGCWSFSGGRWQALELGVAYAMDPTVLHGAVNWGDTRRVHLMLDLKE